MFIHEQVCVSLMERCSVRVIAARVWASTISHSTADTVVRNLCLLSRAIMVCQVRTSLLLLSAKYIAIMIVKAETDTSHCWLLLARRGHGHYSANYRVSGLHPIKATRGMRKLFPIAAPWLLEIEVHQADGN